MKGNNSSKKRWVSTVLMTGIILAGMVPAGTVVNAVSRDDATVSTQESSQVVGNPKSGFEKITTDADAQKTKKDSSVVTDKETTVTEDKAVSNVKDADTSKAKEDSKTDNDKKMETNKAKAAVPTAGYVEGAGADPTGETWESKDYSANSSTEYVSPTGLGTTGEAALYFGNGSGKEVQPFQPLEQISKGGATWTYMSGKNPKKSYGIIIDGKIPADRGYGYLDNSSTEVNSIETAVKNGKVIDYKLYKNTRKTGFKATMYDPTYNLSYTFIEIYDSDAGISSYFSITNNGTTSRAIGAVEAADPFVDTDEVPVMSLGPGAGFKMEGKPHTLNFRLNDPDGNRMGGWTNYTAGNIGRVNDMTQNRIYFPEFIGGYFTGGATGPGMEGTAKDKSIAIYDIKNPEITMNSDKNHDMDSGFILKTNPKILAPGEALMNGSYMTYNEVQPGVAPVATVTPSTINAYADLATGLKITGTVKDTDSTKGRIKITYPDKSTSATTENAYNTVTANTSIPYSANIDSTKLKPGLNELTVTAIDDKKHEQDPAVKVTVNLITLGATPITQNIKVGGTVSTVEKDLISDIKILNSTGHTLKPDTSNPSKNPVNTGKVGHYIHDMLLTDVLIVPNKVAKIAIPVNVTDSDTATDNTSAVYAHKFETKTTDIAKLSDAELNALIILKSEAKGWILETGANSAVSVRLTTLKATSPAGTYKATITNAAGKEITIDITVTGGDLKITSAPDAMNYGATSGVMLPYSTENFNLQRQDNSKAKVSISNAGQQGWKLSASVSKPLTNGTNTLKGVLKYVDTGNVATDLDSGSVTVGSGVATQDVTWDAKQGIIANLNGNNTSLKAGKYAGEITWTLTDAP
ncbi:hypothetical protein LABALGNA3A7_04390 [Dellaglioa algida]|nr:hypothetical protein LABALGNA3A7_04390 [Dellaglioa algida]